MKCKHCGRAISNIGSDGLSSGVYHHTEGRQRLMMRCWPEDSGKPYGLNAEPETRFVFDEETKY